MDAIADFAETRGMTIQGTILVWHQYLPAWAEALTGQDLSDALENHIRRTVARYRDRIDSWIVVNEPLLDVGGGLRNSIFLDELGPGYIADAFQWARDEDPDAVLLLNDFGADGLNAKSDELYALAQDLLVQGVPIDGVGLQMHLGGITQSFLPPTVRANMQRFADLGLEVQVTELDYPFGGSVEFDDFLAEQRAAFHSVVSSCLSVSTCTTVTVWGVDDPHSWLELLLGPGRFALPFDENYLPKPSYYGLRDGLAGR